MELNTRTARFARGELPLLLIRPINNDGPQITAEDIGKLLPQLGLDRSYTFPKYNAPKPKYSYKENTPSYKPEYKPEQVKPFYPSKDPEYLKEQEHLRQIYLQQQKQHHHQQQNHQQQPQQYHQQQHYQQIQQQQHQHQLKQNYPKATENRFYIPHQPENYPQENYSNQKQNQYPREEVVVGKPGISYHENYHTPSHSQSHQPQKNDFYIPKDEHVASFEVKSKAEFVHPQQPSSIKSYDYTPKVINTITAEDASNNYNFSPEKHQYQKQQQKHTLFNQAPQIEYFIPKEQEQADVQVHSVASGDEKDYFNNLKTDEYFLPKFEPEYHSKSPKYPQIHQQYKSTPQNTEYNLHVQDLVDKYASEHFNNPQIDENQSEDSYSKPDSYLNLKTDYEDETEDDETEVKFSPESYVHEAQHQQIRQLKPHALKLKSEVRPVIEFSDDITTKRIVKPRIQTEAPQVNTPAPEIKTEQNLFEPAENQKRFTTPRNLTFKSRLSRSTVAPTKFQVKSSEPAIMISGPGCERQCIRNTASTEYEPVCGSDGKTYSNKGKLNCVQQCSDIGE